MPTSGAAARGQRLLPHAPALWLKRTGQINPAHKSEAFCVYRSASLATRDQRIVWRSVRLRLNGEAELQKVTAAVWCPQAQVGMRMAADHPQSQRPLFGMHDRAFRHCREQAVLQP
jgi:hypothetical protein